MIIDLDSVEEDVETIIEHLEANKDKIKGMCIVTFDHTGVPAISYMGSVYDIAKAASIMQAEFTIRMAYSMEE